MAELHQEVFDHGYVTLVETWGSDERIIEAARMSTGKGFLGWGDNRWQCSRALCDWKGEGPDFTSDGPCPQCGSDEITRNPGDEKLLRFLWENKHHTPFEMAGAIFEVQAPIMVFREWHRHRTQSYNELSARYTPLPDLNYIPTVERLMMNAGGTNKQAGTIPGAAKLTDLKAQRFQRDLKLAYEGIERVYHQALEDGVPKELARLPVPVGRYSRMRASANLRNWLAFLSLRMDKNAQFEIRHYATVVHSMLYERFPRTLDLFSWNG